MVFNSLIYRFTRNALFRLTEKVSVFTVVFCTLLFPPCLTAKTSEWVEYSSRNFVVFSDRKPSEAKALISDFERFRSAALGVTGLPDAHENIRTQIFIFNRKSDYRGFEPDSATAGYFRDTWQGPRMVVGAEAKLVDAGVILFHEYVHHLMRSRSKMKYPLWYEEGFADLLASSIVHERSVSIGLVHSWRSGDIDRYGIMPIEKLLFPSDTDDARYWAQYYASSWLLMHFLQMGHRSGGKDYRQGLMNYLIEGKHHSLKSWSRHLGATPEQMNVELKKYAQQKFWPGYRLDIKPYRGALSERKLSANEVAYLLGDLAYRSARPETALEWLKRVDAKHATVARAFSLRAVIEERQGRSDVAMHVLGLALKEAADDAYVLTNAAHVYWYKARQPGVRSARKNEWLERAEDYAKKAISVDATALEAGYFLAQTQQSLGRLHEAIQVLDIFQQQYPVDTRLALELGQLLIKASRSKEAIPYLERVVAWDHGQARRQRASTLLKEVGALDSPSINPHQSNTSETPIQIRSKNK